MPEPGWGLEFCRERYVPGQDDPALAYEHLHRYFWAAELATGYSVLDIACGTGYGSRILASRASRVLGIDLSPEAIAYARAHYAAPNLSFEIGACEDFVLKNPVDIVISFETLEHFREHERFLDRVKASLRPGGALILSTPNRSLMDLYLPGGNPYHKRELDPKELRALLGSRFRGVRLLGQRLLAGSFILPLERERMRFGPKLSIHAFAHDAACSEGHEGALGSDKPTQDSSSSKPDRVSSASSELREVAQSPGNAGWASEEFSLAPFYTIAVASDDPKFGAARTRSTDFLADNNESLWRRLNRFTGLERQLGRWLTESLNSAVVSRSASASAWPHPNAAESWLLRLGEIADRLERLEEEVAGHGGREAGALVRLKDLEEEVAALGGREAGTLVRLHDLEEEVAGLAGREPGAVLRLASLEQEMVKQGNRSEESLRRVAQLEEEMVARIRHSGELEGEMARLAVDASARLRDVEQSAATRNADLADAISRLERLECECANQSSLLASALVRVTAVEDGVAAQTSASVQLAKEIDTLVEDSAGLQRRVQDTVERVVTLARDARRSSDELSQLQRRTTLLDNEPALRLLRRFVEVLARIEARIVGILRPVFPPRAWSYLRRRRAVLLGLPPEAAAPVAITPALPTTRPPSEPRILLELEERQPPPHPALSCILMSSSGQDCDAIQRIEAWLSAQTRPPDEIVFIDTSTGSFRIETSGRGSYALADIRGPRYVEGKIGKGENPLAVARGRYVAVLDECHTGLSATVLENAVLALETEGLLFATSPVPGGDAELTVYRAAALDLRTSEPEPHLLEERLSRQVLVGGRILVEPSDAIAADAATLSWNMQKLAGRSALRVGRHIVCMPPGVSPPETVRHRICTPERMLIDGGSNGGPTAVVLFPFLAIGGAEILTGQVLQRLANRFRFIVVALEAADPGLGSTAEMFRAITPYVYFPGENSLPQLNYGYVVRLLRRFDARALFVANGSNWFYDALSTLRANFPALRISNQLFDHREGWIRRFDRTLVENIDAHVAVNGRIRGVLVEEHGISEKCIYLINHGIDLDEFDPTRFDVSTVDVRRRQLGIPSGKLVVAFIARLHPQKRPVDFLCLAKRLEADSRYHFLLVGDGPIAATVDRFQELYRLPNLTRLPFYRPINELLALIDVLCITSEYEALPLIVLNALAMGVPVISTDVGSIGEVVADGDTGVLIPIGDLDKLTAALFSVSDPDFRVRARSRGRATVADRFEIGAVAEAYARAIFGEDVPGVLPRAAPAQEHVTEIRREAG